MGARGGTGMADMPFPFSSEEPLKEQSIPLFLHGSFLEQLPILLAQS